MSKYKCIIFDCDGVLVDTESISNQVLLEMVEPFGFKMDIEKAIEKFSGRSLKDCLALIENEIHTELPPDFVEKFREKTFIAFQKEVKPINGVIQLLDKLTLPYCTASSGPLNKIKLNLKTAGLLDKFDGKIFSSYEINSWKPDPGIFLHAAKEMGFQPEECIVIEDALAGIKAAKSGGFTVFGFSNTRNEDLFKKIADRTFSDMDGLYQLIECG